MKRLVVAIFVAVRGQFAQEHRRQDFPLLDRDHDAQEILPMGFDQVPIDDILAEERIDMFIMRFARGTVEFQVFPVADAWHEFDSQEKGQPKNRQVLSLGIGVDGGWLDAGTVPYQCIEKINSFPYPWSYELRKKKDIHITDMIRDSQYFGSCLRSKNATGWLHGEREPTSIGQARRRLVHPFAKHRQVSIEHAVVERSDLNLNVCGVLRNRAGELKKRQQTSPGSLGIGCGKVAITRPHRQIRQSHFEDRHRVIFPAVKLSRRVTPPTRLQNRTCAF
jgi:hypothetical protein